MIVLRALVLFAVLFVVSCGFDSTEIVLPDGSAGSHEVIGQASKGPVAGATIRAYELDGFGMPAGAAIAETVSDDDGRWSFTLADDHAPLLVTAAGGEFVDEADFINLPRRRLRLPQDETLLSVIPTGADTAAITLYTSALVEKSRRETANEDFASVFESNRALFAAALGVDPVTTAPADPLNPTGSEDQRRYAMMIGGAAGALNTLAIALGSPAPQAEHIELLVSDLVDCRLDLRGVGAHLLAPGDPAELVPLDITSQILVFRNNNFSAYEGMAPVEIDACPDVRGEPDTTAPVFTELPAVPTLPARSAQGIPRDDLRVSEVLAGIVTRDDRPGPLTVANDLPDPIPLGRTDVALSVLDAWGNEGAAAWSVTVADLEPPTIVAPPDVEAAAIGPLTQVALGAPQVSDNVSLPGDLQITNDAPPDGFAVGVTAVLWQVTDAAGQSGTAVQQVTINGQPPQQTGPLAPLQLIEGQSASVELGANFRDPEGEPLVFTLAGLPAGSGLSMSGDGDLSGMPSAADVNASPVTVTLIVADSQSHIEVALTITVLAANQPPSFTLQQDAIELPEDFAGVEFFAPTPDPVSGNDIGQSVTYTLVPAALEFVDLELDPASGELAIRAVADEFGTATLTLIADDGQPHSNTFERSFDITISPVNDAPRIVAVPEPLDLDVGQSSEWDLALLFDDVDDATLTYQANGLSRSFVLDDGLVQALPGEVDALVGSFAAEFVAVDAAGASATLAATVMVSSPDSDGDGLPDHRELLLGTDHENWDSDNDGVGDGIEVQAGGDPLVAAANVIVVEPDGADTFPPGLSAAQPTYLLYAQDQRYTGAVELSVPCDNIVFVGSVSTSGVQDLTLPTTTWHGAERLFSANGCSGIRLHNLVLTGARDGALHLIDTEAYLGNVHLVGNHGGEGGAMTISGGSVTVANSVVAANASTGVGGGIAAYGPVNRLTIRDTVISGNRAEQNGGGLYFFQGGGEVQIFASLLIGNRAQYGGAVYFSEAKGARLEFSTLAYNQADGEGAAIAGTGGGLPVIVSDNILYGNRDAENRPSPVGSGFSLASSHNLLEQAPLGANDLDISATGAGFTAGYFLATTSEAVDSGSDDSAALGLDQRFTAQAGPDADLDRADRGYHYARPFGARNASRVTAVLAPDWPGAGSDRRPLLIRPLYDGAALGAGHRVLVRAPADKVLIGNVSNVRPGVGDAVLATDLGRGDYLVWGNRWLTAGTTLEISLDGLAPQTATVTCALGACGGPWPGQPAGPHSP